jgi:hypothetical protein
MHPPPLPAGFRPLLLWLTLAPWPLMLVSLPSKMGEVSGLDAHLPQSQYYLRASVCSQSACLIQTYRLSSVIPTLSPQGLLIGPGVIPMP